MRRKTNTETMGTSTHTKKVVDEILEVVDKELLKKGYFT